MFIHFNFYNVLFNGLAVLIVATGMIVGPILENSILVACLAAVGMLVKDRTVSKNSVSKWRRVDLLALPMPRP